MEDANGLGALMHSFVRLFLGKMPQCHPLIIRWDSDTQHPLGALKVLGFC